MFGDVGCISYPQKIWHLVTCRTMALDKWAMKNRCCTAMGQDAHPKTGWIAWLQTWITAKLQKYPVDIIKETLSFRVIHDIDDTLVESRLDDHTSSSSKPYQRLFIATRSLDCVLSCYTWSVWNPSPTINALYFVKKVNRIFGKKMKKDMKDLLPFGNQTWQRWFSY